jgi:hypothetical protein
MNLFAEGTRNNPNDKARKEQEEFQAWQLAENEKLAKAQAEFIAQRQALMATMSPQEWEEFLQDEAIENAKRGMKEYELR